MRTGRRLIPLSSASYISTSGKAGVLLVSIWCLFLARAKGTTKTPALDRKVPVTQTLSFCQMHFLSPLPVAFDRKLVSVFPFLGVYLSRARKHNFTEESTKKCTFALAPPATIQFLRYICWFWFYTRARTFKSIIKVKLV